LVEQGRSGKLDLSDSFPPEVLAKYKDKRLDVRDLNDGKGLPFNTVAKILKNNADNMKKIEPEWEYVGKIIAKIQAKEDADKSSDAYYLETFFSIDEATQCVYGVLKDYTNKRIIVVFRGSTDLSTRDWQTNFSAQLEGMTTPKLLVDSLDGHMKERVLVHRGFYNYIFNNKLAKGVQRYDMILNDIKPSVEKGYKIYVTGHSLGAALSFLLAFKLAGSDKAWIPKPITCINYASPFVGASGFRAAFTQLEKMGLIRYLRITNDFDTAPAIPPISIGCRKKFMKHVGINLRCQRSHSFWLILIRVDL
jgi:predicted lipase